MIGWLRKFSSNLKKVGPARFLIYLGFILVQLSEWVYAFQSDRDPEAFSRSMLNGRPEYPYVEPLFLSGLVLIVLGPWLSKGSFVQRLTVFWITLWVFMLYMIPMGIHLIESGVPLQ